MTSSDTDSLLIFSRKYNSHMTDDFEIKPENVVQSFWSYWNIPSHRDSENDKECFYHLRLVRWKQLSPSGKDIVNAIPIFTTPQYFNYVEELIFITDSWRKLMNQKVCKARQLFRSLDRLLHLNNSWFKVSILKYSQMKRNWAIWHRRSLTHSNSLVLWTERSKSGNIYFCRTVFPQTSFRCKRIVLICYFPWDCDNKLLQRVTLYMT